MKQNKQQSKQEKGRGLVQIKQNDVKRWKRKNKIENARNRRKKNIYIYGEMSE